MPLLTTSPVIEPLVPPLPSWSVPPAIVQFSALVPVTAQVLVPSLRNSSKSRYCCAPPI